MIGKRVDQMESGFMMALDYMINLAKKDQDDKRKSLLEIIKETILSHLTKKCPPHVQVVGCYAEPLGKKANMITYALIRADWSNLEALHIHIIFVGDMIPLSSTEQFPAVEKLKDQLLENNEKTKWVPAFVKLCASNPSKGVFVRLLLSMSSTTVVLNFFMEKNSVNALHRNGGGCDGVIVKGAIHVVIGDGSENSNESGGKRGETRIIAKSAHTRVQWRRKKHVAIGPFSNQ
ncbi:unnamed protein product [Lactuca saligna]|uniref:Uncharacterized protein n=1 Tax=Lactuca saligna TaxID=75948 RepID=A0AA35YY69_LACSI|nr:unnamed protein product [Lactuca saligna]